MSDPAELFLATMFSGEAYASPDTGLLVASSLDGVSFCNIRDSPEPLYTPTGGLRDPMLLYRHGQWYMVFSYGGDISPLIFVAKSSDLLHWTPVVTLRLTPDTDPNYIDVPQWIVDPAGQAHIIACADAASSWVEIHPLSQDPDTWGDEANWSAVATLTDDAGERIVQGNTFVTLRDGTYYMAFNGTLAFNGTKASPYYMRTSTSLTSGWSSARELDIDSSTHAGDSENLLFLSDGTLRFYISNGNFRRHVIWHVDSPDLGVTWTSPQPLRFEGFVPPGVNWAQVVRITDPEAIAACKTERCDGSSAL